MTEHVPTVYTVGHATRTQDELIGLLRAHDVELVADVRTRPVSHRQPHLSGAALRGPLAASGIDYRPLPLLGGRRTRGLDPSPNGAWQHPGFRNVADYMLAASFWRGLEELIERAHGRRTALMCAAAVPWHGHRGLISDALVASGVGVLHILRTGPPWPHALYTHAVVGPDGRVRYPAPAGAHAPLLPAVGAE